MQLQIKDWLTKNFTNIDLDQVALLNLVQEMIEEGELTEGPLFLYELAKINSEAAFLFWQISLQKKISENIFKKSSDSHNYEFVFTTLFPKFYNSKETLYLIEGIAVSVQSLVEVDKPMAFRVFNWGQIPTGKLGNPLFTYDEMQFKKIIKEELMSIAIIVAGIKWKSYELAKLYASQRVQGGRLIKDWSLIQSLLSELFIIVESDEILILNSKLAGAFQVLKSSDQFVSLNMQVFGGAGYMEDYSVERLFRECQFLKNWPKPLKAEILNHYQSEV